MHKYGHKLEEDEQEDEALLKAFEDYKSNLQTAKLNMKNAKVYVNAFMARDDITAKLKGIPDDMLLICGNRSAYVHNMEAMYTHVNKTKVRGYIKGIFKLKKKPKC